MILKCESCIESWNFPTFFDWLLFIPGPRPLKYCTYSSGNTAVKAYFSKWWLNRIWLIKHSNRGWRTEIYVWLIRLDFFKNKLNEITTTRRNPWNVYPKSCCHTTTCCFSVCRRVKNSSNTSICVEYVLRTFFNKSEIRRTLKHAGVS